MAVGAQLELVAWTRSGIGAVLQGSAKQVSLDLGAHGQVPHELEPYQPADVAGIDPRAVLRTTPRDGTRDFEPSLFASVELAQPGFPWLLSGPPDAAGHVLPWITLVVVEDRAGVSLVTSDGRSMLRIEPPASPAAELPLLADAWAWAHAQVATSEGATADVAALAHAGGTACSRLIAARVLDSDRKYLACLVPTTPAWTGSETTLSLPVYFSWRFGTGANGDFASLARLIQPHELDASVGHRTVDVSAPGWSAPDAAGASIEATCALRSKRWNPPDAQPAPAAAIGAAIDGQLAAAADPPSGSPPVLAPPYYGSAATSIDRPALAPAWQRALNERIEARIAAGIGAELVRADVDTLVEAAWQAAGDTVRINHAIQLAELAAMIAQRIGDKHLGGLATDAELLAVARPMLTRMRVVAGPGPTLAAAVATSAMPAAALSPNLRRLGRANGVLARQAPVKTGNLVARVDAGQIAPAPPKHLASGATAFDAISAAVGSSARLVAASPQRLDAAAVHWKAVGTTVMTHGTTHPIGASTPISPTTATAAPHGTVAVGHGTLAGGLEHVDVISETPTTPAQIDEFVAAARRHQAYILARLSDAPPVLSPLGDLTQIRAAIAAKWTPADGILPVLRGRLDGLEISDFTPVRATPVFEQPLVRNLIARAPELVMPGIGTLLANRAAVAVAFTPFVAALLLGANEQLARELLWRRYPGALGHLWLRTFWGRMQVGADGQLTRVPDLPPLDEWGPVGPTPPPETLALVVRAEVLQRYPNAVVYAVPAGWQGTYRTVTDAEPRLPVFVSSLGSDVALFGFELSAAAARGGDVPSGPAGWYFVIAEHPHEPRFGLAATVTENPTAWQQLSRRDVAPDLRGAYLRLDGPLEQRQMSADPGLRWGHDATQLATITLRHASRVALHASTLLP